MIVSRTRATPVCVELKLNYVYAQEYSTKNNTDSNRGTSICLYISLFAVSVAHIFFALTENEFNLRVKPSLPYIEGIFHIIIRKTLFVVFECLIEIFSERKHFRYLIFRSSVHLIEG